LEKVSVNQTLISQILLDMTHGGKGPRKYANREASGSHGGNRHQQEYVPYHHSEGSHGGGASQGQVGNRTTPRSYLPSFMDEQPKPNHPDEFED
jgi:hypothetical protein